MKQQLVPLILRRLSTWRASSLYNVIDLLKDADKPVSVNLDGDEELARLHRRVQSKAVSKAAKELLSSGIHEPSETVLEELKNLHAPGLPPPV